MMGIDAWKMAAWPGVLHGWPPKIRWFGEQKGNNQHHLQGKHAVGMPGI
jgi:hypothetical protein